MNNEIFIKKCYELAIQAGKKGYDTFGAILVNAGKILEEAENTSDYKNKMKQQPDYAQTYNTKASNNETARNVLIGAAAAFYVWNIIDGIASKGKNRIVVKKTSRNFAVAPIATFDGAGLSLTYNF